MAAQTVNLQKAFKTVTTVLKENQTNLNQADTYNHDHGDHMVETFEVITQAMKTKKNAPVADQLQYASQLLQEKESGSAKIYSQNLANAASRFQGKQVTRNNGMDLITSLLGSATQSTQQSSGQGDALSGLLGGLMGGSAEQSQAAGDPLSGLLGGLMGGGQQSTSQTSSTEDPLAGLLGGLMGGNTSQQPASSDSSSGSGLDMGDLLQAGMSYMQAKQQGKTTAEALIGAVLAASPLAGNAPREQSGSLIANTLMQVIGSMGKKK